MAAPARRPRALLALGLALLAAAAAAATDPFSPQLGDTGGCRGQCGRSLQRRAAADAVLNACYRGCRLFSICHFVDASAELNTTRAECEAACAEAYGNAEEQFGCVTGCRKQLPEVEESRKEKSLELKLPSFSMLDLVSTFCNDIVSSAQSFISSTWTFYLQADDGKVVVFQSQPEMEFPAAEALEIQPAQPGSGSGSSPGVPQPHTGAGGAPGKGGQAPREGAAGQRQGPPAGAPAAGARLPGLHVQALGPSSLDPGRLPLPLHHGDAVAQLCQPGHRPRAARQDPASEHQRGQGVPGGPGRPRCVPAAARHHRHPVPRARRGGRGAAAPQSRPGQDHPVGLPSFPTASTSLSPSPGIAPAPARLPPVPQGHLRLPPGHGRSGGGSGAGQRLCLPQGCAASWDPGLPSREGAGRAGRPEGARCLLCLLPPGAAGAPQPSGHGSSAGQEGAGCGGGWRASAAF